MRKLLSICSAFAVEDDVRFNATESKCTLIKVRNARSTSRAGHTNPVFQINNGSIEYVDSYKHLGHFINSKFEDADDILDKRTVFVGQVNNVLGYFNMLDAVVKPKLYSAYCSIFYDVNFDR
jgi:hypothetical protein